MSKIYVGFWGNSEDDYTPNENGHLPGIRLPNRIQFVGPFEDKDNAAEFAENCKVNPHEDPRWQLFTFEGNENSAGLEILITTPEEYLKKNKIDNIKSNIYIIVLRNNITSFKYILTNHLLFIGPFYKETDAFKLINNNMFIPGKISYSIIGLINIDNPENNSFTYFLTPEEFIEYKDSDMSLEYFTGR